MERLTPEGQQVVVQLVERHGFSEQAVTHMLFAVLHGNGGMAQFNHPEFAGSGQWMRGGMMMLGDMFNHALKSRVDALCNDISDLLAAQPGLLQTGSFQSQSQSGGGQQSQGGGWPGGGQQSESGGWPGGGQQSQSAGSGGSSVGGMGASLFVPEASGQWWPAELGQPNAKGSQNDVHYAYFANARRLAVNVRGQVRVYDTLDHQISGLSQQQGGGTSVLFTSQHGTVDLAKLPVISGDAAVQAESAAGSSAASPTVPAASPAPATPDSPSTAAEAAQRGPGATSADEVFSAIERLGKLRDNGLLSEEEFTAKKAELLQRI